VRCAASATGNNHRVPITGDNKATSAPGSAALFSDYVIELDGRQTSKTDQDAESFPFGDGKVALHAGALTAEYGSRVTASAFGPKDFDGQAGHAGRDDEVDDGPARFDRLRT
jgi:hypothetical protein